MKTKKLPHFESDAFRIPDNFFAEQGEALVGKAQKLEDWKLKVTESPDKMYPLPKGNWLKMEENIRTRLSPKASPIFNLKSIPSLTWAMGSVGLFILGFSLILFWNQQKGTTSDWQAIIDQSTESELIGYVLETSDNEKLESILLAKLDFPEPDNGLPGIQISSFQIEQSLEESTEIEELTY